MSRSSILGSPDRLGPTDRAKSHDYSPNRNGWSKRVRVRQQRVVSMPMRVWVTLRILINCLNYPECMKSALVILAIAGALQAATPQYTVTPIATPAGWAGFALKGLNNVGQLVGIGYNGTGTQALVLTAGVATAIPQVPGLFVSAIGGINDQGLISGCCYLGTGFVGTVNGVAALSTVNAPSRPNSSGQMATACFETPPSPPFPVPCIVTTSGAALIPLPAASEAVAYPSSCCTINDAGQVATTGMGVGAIVGTPAGSAVIPLPSSWPPASGSSARGINNSGHVLAEGANAAGLGQAFIWSGSTSTAIPLPPGNLFFGVTGETISINDSDVVVGPSDDVGWWIWDAARDPLARPFTAQRVERGHRHRDQQPRPDSRGNGLSARSNRIYSAHAGRADTDNSGSRHAGLDGRRPRAAGALDLPSLRYGFCRGSLKGVLVAGPAGTANTASDRPGSISTKSEKIW